MTSISDGYDEILEALEELLRALAEAAPLATTAGLIGVASMVVPRLLVPTSLSGLPPNNFIGPQPGQPGGNSNSNKMSMTKICSLSQFFQILRRFSSNSKHPFCSRSSKSSSNASEWKNC